MIVFNYSIGCRHCLNGWQNRSWVDMNNNRQDYVYKTEFEMSEFLSHQYKTSNSNCEVCGSQNLQFFDVEMDDYRFYDFEKLVQISKKLNSDIFHINIDKSRGSLKLTIGGKNFVSDLFIERSLRCILNAVEDFPNETFESHENGHLFVATSQYFNIKGRWDEIPQIDKFILSGISKNEIYDILRGRYAKHVSAIAAEINESKKSKSEIVMEKKWWKIW